MHQADTYPQPHWYTGELKTRCAECHRVVFADQADAERAAARISERVAMCAVRRRCGHWHVTLSRPKRKRDPQTMDQQLQQFAAKVEAELLRRGCVTLADCGIEPAYVQSWLYLGCSPEECVEDLMLKYDLVDRSTLEWQ